MVKELPLDLLPINVIYQTSRLGPNRLEVLEGPQKDQEPNRRIGSLSRLHRVLVLELRVLRRGKGSGKRRLVGQIQIFSNQTDRSPVLFSQTLRPDNLAFMDISALQLAFAATQKISISDDYSRAHALHYGIILPKILIIPTTQSKLFCRNPSCE